MCSMKIQPLTNGETEHIHFPFTCMTCCQVCLTPFQRLVSPCVKRVLGLPRQTLADLVTKELTPNPAPCSVCRPSQAIGYMSHNVKCKVTPISDDLQTTWLCICVCKKYICNSWTDLDLFDDEYPQTDFVLSLLLPAPGQRVELPCFRVLFCICYYVGCSH